MAQLFFSSQVRDPDCRVRGKKRSELELRGAKRRSAKLKRASQQSQILGWRTITAAKRFLRRNSYQLPTLLVSEALVPQFPVYLIPQWLLMLQSAVIVGDEGGGVFLVGDAGHVGGDDDLGMGPEGMIRR